MGPGEDQVECMSSALIGTPEIILATVCINTAGKLFKRITDLQKANKVLRGAAGRKRQLASPVLSPQFTRATVSIQRPLCYCKRTFNKRAIFVVVQLHTEYASDAPVTPQDSMRVKKYDII